MLDFQAALATVYEVQNSAFDLETVMLSSKLDALFDSSQRDCSH